MVETATINGKNVVYESDSYGDWILVMNYEHYAGTDPESSIVPESTFPQLPNGKTTDSDVQNMGGNGELSHVDNISQWGSWNVDAVRIEGYSSSHSRKMHYFTTNSTVISAIVDGGSVGHSPLASNLTKYSDHGTYLPDNVATYSETTANSNRIFGYEFPMYGDGDGDSSNEHWALSGNGNRWEMDDYPGDSSHTTVHRVWVRKSDGIKPASPNNVDATYVSDDQVDFSWDADTSGGPISSYDVEIERDSSGFQVPTGGPSSVSHDGTTSYVKSYGPNSDNSYGSQVGIDSSFRFRVRAVGTSGAASGWTYSDTVYTSPIPPHNPSVSRPSGTEITLTATTQADHVSGHKVQYREDTGSGYGNWENFDWINQASETDGGADPTAKGNTWSKTFVVGESYHENYGGLSIYEDARYQFRINTAKTTPNDSGWARSSKRVYADYGNEGNVYFSDDFESGDLSNWDSTNLTDANSRVGTSGNGDLGTNGADEGSYFVQLVNNDYAQVNLGDLSSESDVLIKCTMASGSLDSGSEYNYVQWYDGSNWQNLEGHGWEYNKQGWVEVGVKVPDSMLSTDNRMRIQSHGGGPVDFAGFDRVVVSDVLHEYTTPAAPSGLSASGGNRELSANWTDNAATFPESSIEVRTRVTNSSNPFDKNGIDVSSTSYTWKPGSGFDEPVPNLDGEKYDVRVDYLSRQQRHGSTETWYRASSSITTATTIFPSLSGFSITGISGDSFVLSWNSDYNNGSIEVLISANGGSSFVTDATLSSSNNSHTTSEYNSANSHILKVRAFTDHASAESGTDSGVLAGSMLSSVGGVLETESPAQVRTEK